MEKLIVKVIFISLLGISLLQLGCTAVQTYPHIVRAGDTITLALGSTDGMTRGNTTVFYTSDTDLQNPIPLHDTGQGVTGNLLGIFNLYPDKTSELWLNNTSTGLLADYSGHGAWVTIMALNIPATVPAGTGEVRVTTSATLPASPAVRHVNDVPIALEILPASAGAGVPNPLLYDLSGGSVAGNVADLEAVQKIIVAPPLLPTVTGNPKFAAAEVTVTAPSILSIPAPLLPSLRVVVEDMRENIDSRLQTSWSISGDTITVIFISANGNMEYFEPRFNIIPFALTDGAVTSVKYFDINGVEVIPPSPVNNPAAWRVDAYDVSS